MLMRGEELYNSLFFYAYKGENLYIINLMIKSLVFYVDVLLWTMLFFV